MTRLIIALFALLSVMTQPAIAQVIGTAPSTAASGSGQRFVFGSSPWRFSTAGFWTTDANSINETNDVWLPPLPGGGWVVFANFSLSISGSSNSAAVVREQYPGNINTIDWATAFTSSGGTGTATALNFADGQASAVMQSGGFAFLWVPPSGSARWLRYSITTPLGGKRPQGANGTAGSIGVQFAEVKRWKSAFVTGEKTTGSISGSVPFNNNGFSGPSLLLEPWTGQSSVLMLADSIGQQDDVAAYFASTRNMVGAIPRGLDDPINGRAGVGNFTNHGANMLDFMATGSGYFSSRGAIIAYARIVLNSGRMWPMTAIWSELGRNDLHNGIASTTDNTAIVAAMKARYAQWWSWLQSTYRGVPIIQSTITPYSNSNDQWTTVTGQTSRESPANTTALGEINNWLASKPSPLTTVVDWSSVFLGADQGDNLPRWQETPFSAAGGGLTTVAITTSPTVSATNTGVTFSATVAPQIGEYLVIEPSSSSNFERIYVRTVTDNGDGTFTVKGIGNYGGSSVNFARAHTVGSIVRSAYVSDGVHPGTAMQMLMSGPVKSAKASEPLNTGTQTP